MNIVSRRLAASALIVASLAGAAVFPALGAERGPRPKATLVVPETEGRVIVTFKADAALMRAQSASSQQSTTLARPQHAQALSGRLGLALTDGRVLGPRTQVLKAKGLSSQQLAERLASQSDVEVAEVDGRMRALAAPSDPLYANGQVGLNVPAVGQWYLRAPTSSTIASVTSVVSSINAEAAWGITTGSSSVVVAVLDTGVRKDHPDLAGKLLPGYDFITLTSASNDSDGRDADASDPGDYGCGETTSSWHGTQTSGLIGAATDNGVGMASVGRNIKVLPVRVLGCGGSGYDSDIQAAMQWAAGIHVDGVPDNTTPAKVLNMSLGAAGACSTSYRNIIKQINDLGAVVVVAAGNDGLDVGTPANCTGAIAVAGLRHSGSKVGYSDLGPTVALAAPAGNCVNSAGACLYPLLSTSNGGTTTPGAATYTGSGDDATLGTSFSAPLVAGTAALMYSANPSLTPAQVLTALKASARPFPSTGFDPAVKACTAPTSVAQGAECYCTTSTCGAGMLDAGAAVALVATATANIVASASSVAVGESASFDGSSSHASSGSLSYQWTIAPTSGVATITSAANASTMTLRGDAAGTVTVTLLVTDGAGKTATASTTLAVTAPVPPTTPTTPTTSSGGGGGAMELGWLLGWLASVIGVWVVTPRPRRR